MFTQYKKWLSWTWWKTIIYLLCNKSLILAMLHVGYKSVSNFPNFWLYMGLSTVYISLHHPHAFLFVNKCAFDQIRVKLLLRISNMLEIRLYQTSKTKVHLLFFAVWFLFYFFFEIMFVHQLWEEQIFLHSSHTKHSPPLVSPSR